MAKVLRMESKPADEETYEFVMPEWAQFGMVIVKQGFVNIDDLLRANRPGSIVRVTDMDAIRIVPPGLWDCDFIAGYVSENP